MYFSAIQPKVKEKIGDLVDEEEAREFEDSEGFFTT